MRARNLGSGVLAGEIPEGYFLPVVIPLWDAHTDQLPPIRRDVNGSCAQSMGPAERPDRCRRPCVPKHYEVVCSLVGCCYQAPVRRCHQACNRVSVALERRLLLLGFVIYDGCVACCIADPLCVPILQRFVSLVSVYFRGSPAKTGDGMLSRSSVKTKSAAVVGERGGVAYRKVEYPSSCGA